MEAHFGLNSGLNSQTKWRDNLQEIIALFPSVDSANPLLLSNYTPYPQERSVIQTLIVSSTFTTNIFQSAIDDLKAATSTLQDRLTRYESYVACQRALLAPIRKIPDEILREIFYHLCGEPGIDTDEPTINLATTSPGSIWHLQAVCVRWRNILQDMPSLWTSFELDCSPWKKGPARPIPDSQYDEIVSQRTRQCLQNSRSLPLSIFLTSGNPHSDPFPISLFADIGNHCHRWNILAVGGDQLVTAVKDANLDAIIRKRGLSQLRNLYVEGDSDADSESAAIPYRIFQGVPMLETFYLSDEVIPNSDSLSCWSNIKKISLVNCVIDSETELCLFLEAMPRLEELIWESNLFEVEPSRPINLLSLRTLVVQYSDPSNYDDPWGVEGPDRQFPLLVAPNLNTLVLSGEIKKFRDLINSLERTAISPKRLVLNGSSAVLTRAAIGLCPNIEELDMADPQVYGQDLVLKGLLRNSVVGLPVSPGPLPNLKALGISRWITIRFGDTLELLKEVMRTRSSSFETSAAALTRLTFTETSEVFNRESSFKQLQNFGKELGIEVILKVDNIF